jgi:hypothetical protein
MHVPVALDQKPFDGFPVSSQEFVLVLDLILIQHLPRGAGESNPIGSLGVAIPELVQLDFEFGRGPKTLGSNYCHLHLVLVQGLWRLCQGEASLQ